jgi:hypothetical protein
MAKNLKIVVSSLLSYVFIWLVILYRISNVSEFDVTLLLFVSIAYPILGYIMYNATTIIQSKKNQYSFFEKKEELLKILGIIILIACMYLSFYFAKEENYNFLWTSLVTTIVFARFADKMFVEKA